MELTRKLFLIFILPGTCDDGFFDLYVLMDRSYQVHSSEFRQMIIFLGIFANGFTLGPSNIQMGIWTFGGTVYRNMKMNKHVDVSTLMQDIGDDTQIVSG